MNLTPGKQQIRATPDLTLDSLSLPKNLFPESLVVRGPSEPDGRIKVIWKSPQRDPSTGEGPVITFYIEPGATDFDDINWKEGIKQKLLEIGADTLEADTAKGNPPFACKFFQEIAANYRFKSIENCSLSGSEVPLLRVWLGRIHNLTIKDAVVELQAQACTVEGLTCENSHLRIFCESSSSIQGLKVDESSYLSGSFKGSIFDGDCRISGHAVNTDFTDAIWECGTLYKLANWLDGMRFSWNTVNREYFDYIADNITVGSLAKDFERFNQRFFDENLDEYLSHLEKDRGCKKTDSVQPTSPLLIQKQIQEVVRLEIPSEPKCIVEVSKGDDLPCAGSLIIENPNTPGNFKDVYPNGFDHRAEAVDAILDVLSQKKSYRLPAPLNTDTQSESQQSVSEEDELAQKQTQLNQLLRNLERRTPAKKDEAGRVRR